MMWDMNLCWIILVFPEVRRFLEEKHLIIIYLTIVIKHFMNTVIYYDPDAAI